MSDIPPPPFAGETAQTVLTRMLDTVDDALIKTEGDIIHDMLAPAALELERAYGELEGQMLQVFPATATSTYLDALALTYGGGMERLEGETDDQLRARLLDTMATPAGAGSASDYKRWLAPLTELGPSSAANMGSGNVNVYIRQYAHDAVNATAPQIAAAQAIVDDRRPITANNVFVAAATMVPENFAIGLTSFTQGELDSWTEGIKSYFRSLAPGDSFTIDGLLATAGIPVSRYSWHQLGYNSDPVIPRAIDNGWRIIGIDVQD